MIIHFFSDSIYTRKFILFINERFDMNEHKFFINCQQSIQSNEAYQKFDNCIMFKSFTSVLWHHLDVVNADRVVMHQLNQPRLMLFWLIFYPKIFKKFFWSIWGSDLYFYKCRTNSLKDSLIYRLFQKFIPNVKFVCTFLKGDYTICSNVYKFKPKMFDAIYPGTINFSFIDKFQFQPLDPKKTINILVGNSASSSNLHIDALEKLSKYANENIHVRLILSYGNSVDYIQQVKKKGIELFKEKISFLEDFLKEEDYIDFLKNTDVCVFNHDIQEGVGNLKLLLSIYKKVYVRSSVSTYQYFSEIGVKLFDTLTIPSLSLNEFVQFDEFAARENRDKVLLDSNEDRIQKMWEVVFNHPI